MTFNFDQLIERKETDSMKWDLLEERFGDKDLLPLWVADMDFKAPEPVIQALKEKVEHGVYGYPKPAKSLAHSIMNWMKKRHDWDINENSLVYTVGVVPALSTAITAYTDVGDNILIQTPVYYPFFHVIQKNNRGLIMNELVNVNGRYEIDFDDFEKQIVDNNVKMFILCSPHNPVGRVWDKQELVRMGEICLKHNVLIISDEIHSDLIFGEHKHIPFASISQTFSDQTVTCMAPSKTFNLAGLHSSLVIVENEKLRSKFQDELQRQALTSVNSFGLVAMEVAYEKGEEWLEQLLSYLSQNINFLKQFFETELPNLKVTEPEGTYLVWVDCRELNLRKSELERLLLKEAKVALNQGYIFGKAGEGFIRINVACPRNVLEDGLKRIKGAIKSL